MKRTQIYISEEMQEKLDALSQTQGSRSEIIREALTEYIRRHSKAERTKSWKPELAFGRTRRICQIYRNFAKSLTGSISSIKSISPATFSAAY